MAGDGACPGGGAGDNRIIRSGSGLYHGKKHLHNIRWRIKGSSRNAQRAEVDAASRWVAWSWSKNVYLTDSAQVEGTLRKVIKGQKVKTKSHKVVWEKIKRAIEAKGADNFKVKKVIAHLTKKEKQKLNTKETKWRLANEEADVLAVKGAKEHKMDKKPSKFDKNM